MTMILYACVVRLQDGLPLSASTDFHPNKQVLECKRKLKALCSTLSRRPTRGTATVYNLCIHFCSAGDVSVLTICPSSYPPALAFCFLEELHWEFTASYDSTTTALVSRPYACLEFDNVIQRIKHNYNMASTPAVPLDPSHSPPPVLLKMEDVEVVNGFLNSYSASHMQPAPNYRMTPVTALGILSLTLNIMCSALSLIRGVHLAEHSFQEDYENAGRVVAFLAAFSANILQCYLYLYYTPARKVKVCILLSLICLCNIYLYGLRNLWQIIFHIVVALFSAQQILTRNTTGKQSDCGV